ncbi:MAG: hypothetical protein J2P19_22395 [Pseudonocardia sp.]|nr:hypothetical protein [Pseudonocardia sp.]
MATLLKGPIPNNEAHAGHRGQIVRAVITELEKSVACGDPGYLLSTSKWVAEQDPDLAEVRKEDQFKDFRDHIFGSRGTASWGSS